MAFRSMEFVDFCVNVVLVSGLLSQCVVCVVLGMIKEPTQNGETRFCNSFQLASRGVNFSLSFFAP